jgi:acetolactate synthase small subunit
MLSRVSYLVIAENHPEVLSRVVMLLHRLAVPIEALAVKRSGKSQTLRLSLEAQVIAGHAERVAENLMKLVHVLSVEIGPLGTMYRRSPSPKSRAGTTR